MELFVFPSEHGLLQGKKPKSLCNPSTWKIVRDVDPQQLFTE